MSPGVANPEGVPAGASGMIELPPLRRLAGGLGADFVGYGTGGFGHTVLNLHANTGAKVGVPGFIKHEDGLCTVHWTPIHEDMVRVTPSAA